MRILFSILICFILSNLCAVDNYSNQVLMPVSAFDPNNTEQDKLTSSTKFLETIFQNSLLRPDPLVLLKYIETEGLTKKSIVKIGRKFKIQRKSIKKTILELHRIIPFLDMCAAELEKRFPDHKIIFLARDGDLIYDFYRVFLKLKYGEEYAQERTYLMPASMYLCESMLKFNPNKPDSLARKFLKDYGIDENSIENGEKFLMVDSGFKGSAGKAIRKLIIKTFSLFDKELKIQQQFPISLLKFSVIDLVEEKEKSNIEQLIKLPEMSQNDLKWFFPKTKKSPAFMHGRDSSMMFADSVQSFPRFTGSFRELVLVDGKPVAKTNDLKYINQNLDYIPERNISMVNPVAALEVMHEIIEVLLKRFQGRNSNNKLKNTSIFIKTST